MCWMLSARTLVEQHLLVRFHAVFNFFRMLYSTANKIEELLSLEARCGSLTEYTPAIDTIIEYLEQVNSYIASVMLPLTYSFYTHKLIGSEDVHDRKMRALLYFMLSRDGSSRAQKVITKYSTVLY